MINSGGLSVSHPPSSPRGAILSWQHVRSYCPPPPHTYPTLLHHTPILWLQMAANYFGHSWFSLRFWRRKNLGTWQYAYWWSYRKHSSHGLSLILFAGWRALSIHRWVLTHRPSRKYHALSLWTYFNALFNNHKPRPPLASLGPLTARRNIRVEPLTKRIHRRGDILQRHKNNWCS